MVNVRQLEELTINYSIVDLDPSIRGLRVVAIQIKFGASGRVHLTVWHLIGF